MNKSRTLTRNVFTLLIVQIANFALPLLSIPIIVRIIGPEKFGVINYASSFMMYFTMLITYGFDLTATRRISKDPHNEDLRSQVFSEVFYAQLVLFTLSVIIFTICLFTIAPLASEKIVSVFSFLYCIGTLFTQNWLFMALQHLHKIAVLNLVSKFLFTILVLLVVIHKFDYVWQPLLLSAIQTIIGLCSFIWAIRMYKLKFKKLVIKNVLELLWHGRVVFISIIAVNLYTVTNIVLLGLFKPEADVGYYTAGQKLVDVMICLINLPMSQALFPVIGFAFGVSRENGIETVHKLLPLIFIAALAISVFAFIAGPTILVWFYGQAFTPSVIVFQILSFTPLIVVLSNIFGVQIMVNLNMDKAFLRITSIGAALSLLLNYVMVHFYGYVGTACSLLAIEIFITVSMYCYLRSKNINPFDFKQFSFKTISRQLLNLKNGLLKKNII